ncbi:hypothetical protein ABE473_01470 [Stenotrophomonas sp. TWI700]|uniref:hypothetical protein n=1 Tax=Stenotrophomonas sp. TWI700 TaxID=3136792 RepID=UPI0032081628
MTNRPMDFEERLIKVHQIIYVAWNVSSSNLSNTPFPKLCSVDCVMEQARDGERQPFVAPFPAAGF